MFYMGGMTLGYFSPHSVDDCASDGSERRKGDTTEKPARKKGLLDFLKPADEQGSPTRQLPAWPIHVFY
jgi:hypothetical protein